MRLAFVYAGQGSQRVGMGKDFYEQYPLFQQTLDVIDPDNAIKPIAFEGPLGMLTKTRNTQPAMVAFAVGITNLLSEEGIMPEFVAGLSLGEYSALYASGVLSGQDVMNVVTFRGEVMEELAEKQDSSMVAILGLSYDVVQAICSSIKEGIVEVANNNCKGQVVIGGEHEAVEQACALAKIKGAKRCMPLQVSGPFHTSFMHEAESALINKFNSVTFNEMKIPVLFNYTGKMLQSNETITELLGKQVCHTVQFEKIIQNLIQQGVDTVIEIGPGKVLSGFIKKTTRDIDVYQIDTVESFENTIRAIKDRG